MPIASTQAFVLGNSPLKEQDRLIHLLTMNRGILRAMAPGSLKFKNRFGSLFELFTEGEFHYYWQENKDLITISKGEILHSYFNIVSDPQNIFYFYLAAEVFLKFIPFYQKDNRLYRLLQAILLHRQEGVEMNLLLVYFLIWVLRIEGMMFDPRLCYNCFAKNIQQAWIKQDFQGILCPQCKTTETLMLVDEELGFIKWTGKNSPKGLGEWKEKIDIAKLVRAFTRKIEYHGECSLKSSQYLSEFR
jgi:DNA repair protein RecO (recombination protein O)